MAIGRHTMGVLLFEVVVYRLKELAVIARLHILRERHDPTAHHPQILSIILRLRLLAHYDEDNTL